MRLWMTIINLNDTIVETPKVEGAGPLRVFWDIFSKGFLGVVKKSMRWSLTSVYCILITK
jgi:hypothetical protein